MRHANQLESATIGGPTREAHAATLRALAGLCLLAAAELRAAEDQQAPPPADCRILADRSCEEPVRAIVAEYTRREDARISLELLDAGEVAARLESRESGADLAICLSERREEETPLSARSGARKVAWKYPTGEAVWAAPLADSTLAHRLCRFLGGPTAHRLWSESTAGFTIVSGATRTEAHQWVVENRVRATYPATAERMLRECGDLREGTCVDVGCGSGQLAVEIAKRSRFKIVGLDIDPDVRPYFEATVRAADLEGRISFVLGDAQKMPFPDDFADLVVSRGVLPFIPDLAQCLREVERILKPSGVAILGGRYLYTPQSDKISTARLKEVVASSGVAGARVVDDRGQWVKIVGPSAPASAATFRGGPDMLALRCVVDYGIAEGDCLLIHGADGELERGLQRGFLENTKLKITALYPKGELTKQASQRIREAGQTGRIECRTGSIEALPIDASSVDLVAGVGPMLIFADHGRALGEVHRVLRRGGAAIVGGRFLGMPEFRRVPSERLREAAVRTGLRGIRVVDDGGQWVEIRKGVGDRELAD